MVVHDLLADGKIVDEHRFVEGLTTPCGAKVEHYPVSAKDKSVASSIRKESFSLPSLWDMRYMERRSWKGNMLVADT